MIIDTSALVAIPRAEPERADFARERGEPLLFKGDDFRHTDLAAATGPPPAQR